MVEMIHPYNWSATPASPNLSQTLTSKRETEGLAFLFINYARTTLGCQVLHLLHMSVNLAQTITIYIQAI
jgi:hypothetical protein